MLFIVSFALSVFFHFELLASACEESFKNDSSSFQLNKFRNYTKNNKQLLKISKKGNLNKLEKVLGQHVNIDIRNKNNQTPLTIAIRKGHTDFALRLIDSGADINRTGRNGISPLSFSAYVGDIKLVRTLLEMGADVHSVDKFGSPPLFWSATKEISELLIEYGSKVKVRNKYKETALMWANNGEQAQFLIDQGIKINAKDRLKQTAIIHSVKNSLSDVSNVLLKNGINYNTKYLTADDLFMEAAFSRDIDMINFLLNVGDIDINKQNEEFGYTALMQASYLGYFELVETLLKNGANPNLGAFNGDTALIWSLIGPHDPKFINPKIDNWDKISELLIENGADVNVQNNQGDTPSILSVYFKRKKTFNHLLEAGADPTIQNFFNENVLSLAKQLGDQYFISSLLKYTEEHKPLQQDREFPKEDSKLDITILLHHEH